MYDSFFMCVMNALTDMFEEAEPLFNVELLLVAVFGDGSALMIINLV